MQGELTPDEVLASFPPHADTIATLLATRRARTPDKTVLEFEHRTWTYAQLDEASTLLARVLGAHGFGAGSRIALVSANTDLCVLLFLAIARLRAVFVPLNPACTSEEFDYLLRHSRAPLVLCQSESLAQLGEVAGTIDSPPRVAGLNEVGLSGQDAADVTQRIRALASGSPALLPQAQADDHAIVIYTSGTTGFPKGVVHSQRNFVLAGEAFVARMYLQSAERLLTLLPFYHINALFYSLGGALAAGATLITARSFSASRFWHLAAETRATEFNFLAAVGNILVRRARSEFDPRHCIRKMYGGPMSEDMFRAMRGEFRVPVLIEGYGMTEIPGACCNPYSGLQKFGSIGLPAVHPRYPGDFSALRIEDDAGKELGPGEVGELVVKTPILFKEYLNDPQQTAASFRNGWFLTGDLARRDADGYFWFVARKKDIIRRRGENISGAELDRVIGAHPEVVEAAAIGVPSDLGEEEILVAVVRQPGSRLEATDILDWCRGKLSPMKMPRFVAFASSLPHTPSHRVAKHRIKADSALIANAIDLSRYA